MSIPFKPFRLVNSQEIKELQEGFAKNLQDWNDQHALFALSCSLSANPKPLQLDLGCLLISEGEHPVALFSQDGLSALKQCLFGDLSDCFNSISKNALTSLLSQMLETPSIKLQLINKSLGFKDTEWFYPGAPSLSLTLSLPCHSMIIYLHPQWVLKKLPLSKRTLKPKANLQEALADQLLQCQVDLIPISLKLNDVINLRVGDVIKTDHKLIDSLLLKHERQTVCQVEPGESNHFKSIQIASSL